MNENEETAGSIRTTEQQKRVFAAQSLQYNFTSIQKFEPTFAPYFDKLGVDPITKLATIKKSTQ